MIFFASVQLSLSVMGLMPMSEGLSLIMVSAVAIMGGVTPGEGGDTDESNKEGADDEPAQVESAVDESQVEDADEGWVRM